MKIELKNIHYSEQLSEETHAFSANLYIEGIKAGTVSNRGRGGPTVYRADHEKGRKLIADAEVYCSSLPEEKLSSGSLDNELKMDLKRYIDKLLVGSLNEKEFQKFQKKLETAMERGIVAGIPGKSFDLWQFNLPIMILLQRPQGPDIVKNAIINTILPELVEGKIIMNTNIPLKLLEEAGLNKNQYAGPVSTETSVNKKETEDKQKRKGRKP